MRTLGPGARAPRLDWLLIATVACFVGFPGAISRAQDVTQAPPERRDKPTRIEWKLHEAVALARRADLAAAELRRELISRFLELDERDRVHVELISPPGEAPIGRGEIEAAGGFFDRSWENRTDAWIPLDAIEPLSSRLAVGGLLRPAERPALDEVAGQGPVVMNSLGYRNAGADGTGITVAIIDLGFANLTAARANGDAPALNRTTIINYTPQSFESGTPHGTGCLETAFDHSPDADWRLYRIDSATDLGSAVNDALANGVDIISHSLGWFNQGWADDSGPICQAANNAASNGVIFCTSAGNYAKAHWQGTFGDTDGDQWHQWDFLGDETINITVPPGSTLDAYLSWDTAGPTHDYDLYLYDSTQSIVLASSANRGNTFEGLAWQNTGPANVTVHLMVLRFSGGFGSREMEVFTSLDMDEWALPADSTVCPSNSTHPNVLSVGAVAWSLYAAPTPMVEDFSSRGPSNSGLTLPDLCGPDATTGFTYPAFFGTSCAAPNVAGAAACLWSADPLLDASAVRWAMVQQSRYLKNWGAWGQSNVSGWGGGFLTDFAPATLWLGRDFNNTSNLRQFPFYQVQPAHDAAVAGGRLLIVPNGSFPEPVTLTKALTIEVLAGESVLGN